MKGFHGATFWIVLFLAVILVAVQYQNRDRPEAMPITTWIKLAEEGKIRDSVDEAGKLSGAYVDTAGQEKKYETTYTPGDLSKTVVELSRAHGFVITQKERNNLFSTLLISALLPVGLLILFWMFMLRQLQGGSNKAMSFGKSKARLVKEGEIKITFKDVAGVDEAKEELTEIVDYLKDPKKFSRLGGRIPAGVLLVGPPGTGKTLLAKAIAGEAGVPFFSISGSDFVEMFVGVGASRVRDLFEQAKKAKPCIIFIDEIDAVGRSRFTGLGGGHDEREQTLNQLLVEMDGFSENEGVILIAATNRRDVLDPALLRPGRFDREVMVDLPDIKGREKILRVHARKVKMESEIDMLKIAKGTPGFSGADLANLINEAALLAARRNKEMVGYPEFEEAKDRVMMGPERRSMVISEKQKLITAYHEAGHAIVAHFTPGSDAVHKVTIVPRGRALGLTWTLPGEDQHNYSRQQLTAKLYLMLGGRAAEEIQFGEFTTGASSDLERVTSLAHRMICQFGMSERLGPRTFGDGGGQVFLGKDLSRERNYSEETAAIIDEELKRIIDDANNYALALLREKKDILDRVSEALVERETLDDVEFKMLIDGQPLPPFTLRTPPESTPPASPTPPAKESPSRVPPPLGGPTPQPS